MNQDQDRKYQERVMQLSAYCALQARVLQLYNSEYNDEAMLREIHPLVMGAVRQEEEGSFRSLEELSEELDERISRFERQHSEIAGSQIRNIIY